mmetsp:Transcript_19233/g.28392  ORF Transcript_19233/g.28392 Transcript_19233/m.28392 type:complete len:162 (+) Transcript_19233:55-540(+)
MPKQPQFWKPGEKRPVKDDLKRSKKRKKSPSDKSFDQKLEKFERSFTNTSVTQSSERNVIKASTTLLALNFMKRGLKNGSEEGRNTQNPISVHEEFDSPLTRSILSKPTQRKSKPLTFEPLVIGSDERIVGRRSFKGFNPTVEKTYKASNLKAEVSSKNLT